MHKSQRKAFASGSGQSNRRVYHTLAEKARWYHTSGCSNSYFHKIPVDNIQFNIRHSGSGFSAADYASQHAPAPARARLSAAAAAPGVLDSPCLSQLGTGSSGLLTLQAATDRQRELPDAEQVALGSGQSQEVLTVTANRRDTASGRDVNIRTHVFQFSMGPTIVTLGSS